MKNLATEHVDPEFILGLLEQDYSKFKSRKNWLRRFYYRHRTQIIFLSRAIQLAGIGFILLIFEFSYLFLLSNIGDDFYVEMAIIQASVIISLAFSVLSTIKSSKSYLTKIAKLIVSILILTALVGALILVMIFFNDLITIKLLLIGFIAYYIVNIYLFVKVNKLKINNVKSKAVILIYLTLSISSGCLLYISLQKNSIPIDAKLGSAEPELIFWCSTNQLPEEPEVLEMCKEHNIAFMPTIREDYIGESKYIDDYKRIIDNEINLYFVIGGNSDFYAHLDNSEEFSEIYKNIRQWFITEGILSSEYVKAFAVDAEPPHEEYFDYLEEGDHQQAIDFGIKNYPGQDEIDDASEDYQEFVRLIKNDNKTSIMVQSTRFLDNYDSDGDFILLMRNIYSLPIEWDSTVTMLYRTNRYSNEEGDSIPEFYSESLSIFYGAITEGTKFTTSLLSFYQNVALEENSKDDLADEHYIFVGNFKREFKDTTYIQKKEYYDDVDICRHFKNNRIFLYNLEGFLYHYGWEGVEELGDHVMNERAYFWMTYSTYKSITFLMFYCGLICIDIFASFEKDLT